MLFLVTYGLGAAAFVALTVLTLVNRRPTGLGLFATSLFAVTAVWAALSAMPVLLPGAAHLLDSLRTWMWLQFLATVLWKAQGVSARHSARSYRIAIPVLGIVALGNDLRFLLSATHLADFALSQVVFRIVLPIAGLLLVENIYRNTVPSRRWHIYPLCIAAGFLFSYDLFVFVEAVIVRAIDLPLLAVRGIILVLIVPLLLVSMARNEDWRVDVHVSRRVVFHGATLTAGGIFLIAAAGAASLFGHIPGDWGAILKVSFFSGSVLVLTLVVSTESARVQIRRLIAENFFSRRYDYREEWMRFVRTLSNTEDADPLQTRVIRALADVVESPGGVLWLADDGGTYRVVARYNMGAVQGHAEPQDSPFVLNFEGGRKVQAFTTGSPGSPASPGPPGIAGSVAPWLAVPLVRDDAIFGFVILAQPRSPVRLNWESFDLLRILGMQVASYLAEERATRALVNAHTLLEYGKRMAFLGHDVKNLANQLGIMVANIRNFGDNPQFRSDMVRTLEHSVDRLNALLLSMRGDGVTGYAAEPLDPAPLLERVAREMELAPISVESDLRGTGTCVRMEENELRSVVMHLLDNAVEASRPGDRVSLRLHDNQYRVVIEVEDRGSGMDSDFVREKLFAPLHSTKPRGHGIGAFQARELIRRAGGELEVLSAVGQGTTMRIVMPAASAAVRQAAPA